MSKLYTKKVDSCIGVIGRFPCPNGNWSNVNQTRFFCNREKRLVDFENKPAGTDSDKYTPKWCTMEDV